MDPLSVSTMDWRPDGTGVSCRRLEPQLAVPAGLVNGELTLFTARQQVSVLHVDDLADYDGRRALALLEDLRQIGAEAPVGSLPPPTRRSPPGSTTSAVRCPVRASTIRSGAGAVEFG